MRAPVRLANWVDPSASLVGAEPHEVAMMGSLTANLHLMMVNLLPNHGGKAQGPDQDRAFPSDRYAVESQIRFHGLEPASSLLVARPRTGEACLRREELAETIEREGDAIALALLPGVQYYTGEVLDLDEITRLDHGRGWRSGVLQALSHPRTGLVRIRKAHFSDQAL